MPIHNKDIKIIINKLLFKMKQLIKKYFIINQENEIHELNIYFKKKSDEC